MRRLGVAALHVVVFVVVLGPLALLSAALVPSLPWWSLVLALVFWVLLIRRRRLAAAGALDPSPAAVDGPRFSPTGGGGF